MPISDDPQVNAVLNALVNQLSDPKPFLLVAEGLLTIAWLKAGGQPCSADIDAAQNAVKAALAKLP